MRNIMAGFAVLSLLAIGTVASATAHPLSVPPVGQSLAVQQADWDGDGCGPRCWEHRREAREREQEHPTLGAASALGGASKVGGEPVSASSGVWLPEPLLRIGPCASNSSR